MSLPFLINIDKSSYRMYAALSILDVQIKMSGQGIRYPRQEIGKRNAGRLKQEPRAALLSANCQEVTGSPNRIPLHGIARQELKSVTQSIPVSHQRSYFERCSAAGQCEFECGHFTWLELARQRDANSVLAEFDGPPPKLNRGLLAKHLGRDANIQRVSGISALLGRIVYFNGIGWASCHWLSC